MLHKQKILKLPKQLVYLMLILTYVSYAYSYLGILDISRDVVL